MHAVPSLPMNPGARSHQHERSEGAPAGLLDDAWRRATTSPMPPGEVADVQTMRLSLQGKLFIIRHEGQRGVSNRLHHPSAGSGVTIGPGYDMKDRSAREVQTDLEAIGVPSDAAAQAAGGAGLSGQAATNFVREHRATLDLAPEQEAQLLDHIAPRYETRVKRSVRVPLHQHEFDAMVSYAYNPGGGWLRTTQLVNESKYHEAMLEIQRHVTSRGQRISSLVRRRAAESAMFLYGEYR